MRDFFRTSPTFWRRGTGKKLRGDPAAQLLAWYLMVPPDGGLTGIFASSIETMSRDTGLSESDVLAALERLDAEDFAYFDPAEEMVWVVGTAKHQIPEGISSRKDNRWTSIVRELKHAGSHEFVRFFVAKYGVQLSVTADDLAGEERAQATDRPSSRLGVRTADPPHCAPQTLPKGFHSARGGRGEGEESGGRAMGEGREGVQGDPAQSQPDLSAPTQASSPNTKPVTPKRAGSRGARIAEDFRPNAKTIAWTETKGVDPEPVLEEFLLHWLSASGPDALKVDWDRAFQKRVLDLLKYGRAPKLTDKPRPVSSPDAWTRKLQAELESAPVTAPTTSDGEPGPYTALVAKVAP